MHTHYDEELERNSSDELLKKYKRERNRFVGQSLKGNIPIITLIKANPMVPGADEAISQHAAYYTQSVDNPNSLSTKIFFVRTFQDHSTPCLTNQEDFTVTNEDTELDNWNLFGNFLATLGVKQIIIRGRNFEYEEKQIGLLDTAESLFQRKFPNETAVIGPSLVKLPAKCLGSAVLNLSVRGFKILRSRLTYPKQFDKKRAPLQSAIKKTFDTTQI